MSAVENFASGVLRRPMFSTAGVRERVARWWLVAGFIALALFLRVANHELSGWSPDTYDRLVDARAIVHGHLPQSPVYPPGAALLIVPFFAFLPDTLETMQAVTILCGVLLVPVCYQWTLHLTGAQRAAILAGGAAAIFPPLVLNARGAQYDIQSLLLTMLALLFASNLRRAPVWGWVAYGVLIAVLLNIRPNNIVIGPALVCLYLSSVEAFRPRGVLRHILHPSVLVVGVVAGGLCVASVLLGEWSKTSAEAHFSSDRLLPNLLHYYYVSAGWAPGVFLLAPFALIGARSLWRMKPYHVAAVVYVLIVWPMIFAPFDFVSDRYMLPPQVLVISLTAAGLSDVLARARREAVRPIWMPGAARLAIMALAVTLSLGSALVVKSWPEGVTESDEGLAREFKPAVEGMEDGSMLVSAVSLVFQDEAPHLEHYNLVYTAMRGGGTEATVDDMVAAIDAHLDGGHRVYYLYSHWEQGSDFTMKGKLGYARYWDAVTARYDTEPVLLGTTVRVTDHTWTLYELKPLSPGAARP